VRHEPLYAHLLTALASTGRSSTAVELFHEVRRDIVAHTEMEPGEMLQQAFLAVVQNAGGPAPNARPRPSSRSRRGRSSGSLPSSRPPAKCSAAAADRGVGPQSR
jgi:hypothetical protein